MDKRSAFLALTRAEILEIAQGLGIPVASGASTDDLAGVVLKRWRVTGVVEHPDAPTEVTGVELVSDNRDFAAIPLKPGGGEVRVVAEFLEVVGE